MTNSPFYAYYSFPKTPLRTSPPESQTPRNSTSGTKPARPSTAMVPSPAAGRGGAPRTPTKLTRRPQQAADQVTGGVQKPSTPHAPKVQKPEADVPEVKDVQKTVEDVPKEAS